MGAVVGRLVETVGSLATGGLKRTLEELEEGDDEWTDPDLDRLMRTPKRRKMVSTMAYVYETMFKGGQGSDVTLHALDRQWRLHKLYLSQSPYFQSMFSDNWREARESEITIEIVDPNITMAGLETALGSLYHDEVELQPANIVSVVAAAALFRLDGLLTQCGEVMRSCINVQTAIVFMEAATAYSLEPVRQCCQRWLENNLMTDVSQHPAVLRRLSAAVLERLVGSPTLLVHQTEFTLYVLLKVWLFLRLTTDWQDAASVVLAAHKFFQQRAAEEPMLDSEEASPLASPFRRLRHQHLVLHPLDAEVLSSDNIIPPRWLTGLYQQQWLTLLRLDQGHLPSGWARDVTEEQFDACALRCGRTLRDRHKCTWRWTGFNFGMDLVMVHSRRQISLRRNARHDQLPLLISQALDRDVMYRVRVVSLDAQRTPSHVQTTPLTSVRLQRGQEVRVLTLDEGATYPLLLSASLMVAPPAWRPDDLT